MSDGLVVGLDGAVLRLLIDRPERANALTPAMLGELASTLSQPPAPARAVLLSASGSGVFSAGADLSMMGPGAGAAEQHRARGAVREAMLALLDCPLPVVARVQGTCLAGAVGLVLACDLVVCSEGAEWGMPEVDRGLWPFMVGVLLARHVSPKRAMDWMATGRRIPAQEAERAGLVSRLCPPDRLDAEVDGLLAELVSKPPLALAAGKAALRAACESSAASALEAMQAQLSVLASSDDAAEGIAAFAERREPRWRGR